MSTGEALSVNRLRETIHHLGKSVEQVAKDLNLGKRTLYNYLYGKVVVPEELRPAFATYLGCSQEFLFPHPSQWLPKESPGETALVAKESSAERTFIDGNTADIFSTSKAEFYENIELLKTSVQEFQHQFAQGVHSLPSSHSNEESVRLPRRETLRFLISIPLAFSSLAKLFDQRFSALVPEEVIPLYATAIPACWRLYYEGDVTIVEQVLKPYLLHLSHLAKESSPYQKQAAALASQGYKLANLLDLHHEDFGMALKHSNEALLYGQQAEDPNLQLAALIEEALTFFYRKRSIQTLETYQKALQLITDARPTTISPIIEGRVHAGLAVAYAQVGQKQDALRSIGLAQETFPEHPEQDPHFAYTHYDQYYLYLYQGLMYMHLHQPEQALIAYGHFNAPQYQPRRAEITNREAAAFLALGDLDRCCATLEAAVTVAVSKHLDLRYSEAHEIYQAMGSKWPSEERVQQLSQLFQR